jgi:hypothetical protein
MRRLILAPGAIFVGLVVSACGSGIPGNSVAVVGGAPITQQALSHWGYVAAVGQSQSAPGSPVIIPDPPAYKKCITSLRKIAPASVPATELKTACVSQFTQTMEYLVRSYWVQGQAAAEGIKVTPAQVMAKFTSAKNAQFKSAAEFKLFLTQTGQTVSDILYRFRISMLATKLATPAAVKAYYQQHMASYSTPERRTVRIILTKTQGQAQAAKSALGHQTWQAVAKRYSIDPATRNTGGLLTAVTNGQEPTALNSAIFAASKGTLLGPIKTPFGYYVAEVTAIVPATTEPLAKASTTIKASISQAALSAPPWERSGSRRRPAVPASPSPTATTT